MKQKKASLITSIDRMQDMSPAWLMHLYIQYDYYLQNALYEFTEEYEELVFPEEFGFGEQKFPPIMRDVINDAWNESTEGYKRFGLDQLKEIVPFAQEVLRTLYERKGLTIPQAKRLQELSGKINGPSQHLKFSLMCEANLRAGFLPFSAFRFEETEFPLPDRIIHEVSNAVVRADMLARCEECKSLFLREARAPRSIYCSTRCGDRVRQRRHTKKDQEELGEHRITIEQT